MALSAAALVADYLVFSLISARHHVTQWSVTFLGGESFEGSRFKSQLQPSRVMTNHDSTSEMSINIK